MNFKTLRSQFESIFRRPAEFAVRAPGRVNLIGEHTDYNGGLVLPIAIERQTIAIVAMRDDRKVALASNQAPGQQVTLDLDQPISPGEPKWTNYPRGVLEYLRQLEATNDNGGTCSPEPGPTPSNLSNRPPGFLVPGSAVSSGRSAVVFPKLVGMDILFDSDVPLGGGLSSSASLEVATAVAALSACDARAAISDRELALLCQKAENVYAGAPCGIMDQSVIVMAQAGHALLLDCRDGVTRHIPFDDPGLVLLVADTQVKHAIGDGGYGARRQQCASAAATMGVQFLRELDCPTIDAAGRDGKLAGKELMRARHVVGEIQRTLDAVEVLQKGDYHSFGKLMYGSHESLRDDFEVSCDELDAIVATARRLDGVYGGRG